MLCIMHTNCNRCFFYYSQLTTSLHQPGRFCVLSMSSSSPPQPQRRKCCPPNAHPALARDESYELRGHVLQLGPGGGLSVYVTGDAPRGSPGLLVAHDIFGPDSGRTKQLCDVLARRLGVLVVLPDFFRGDPFFPEAYGNSMYSWRSVGESLFDLLIRCRALELLFSSNKRASWEVVGRDFEDICIPLLQERGCRKIGVLGFCWGGWFGCHAASNADICCVAAFHPSLEPCFLVGESSAELCAAVNCPVLMITAGEDSVNVKSGGLLSNSIAEKSALLEEQSVFEEFKDMRHGWVNRGRFTGPHGGDVQARAEEALDLAADFLSKHLMSV